MSEDADAGAARRVFGVRPIMELLRVRPRDVAVVYVAEGVRSPEIAEIVRAARDRAITVNVRPRKEVADLAGAPAHQGVVAVTGAYRYATMAEMLSAADGTGAPPLLLILDGITDPQNFGALVRSAEVFGAHGVIVGEHHAAPVTGSVVKASAGATERIPIARVAGLLPAIDELRGRGVRVLGAATKEAPLLMDVDLRTPTAIVVGSEGRGMREAVARRCDGLFHIPARGAIGSLNASVAGAIALYEACRQRRPPATSR